MLRVFRHLAYRARQFYGEFSGNLFGAILAIFIILLVAAFVIAFVGGMYFVVSWVVMVAWNLAIPGIFGGTAINQLQAAGIVLLLVILRNIMAR